MADISVTLQPNVTHTLRVPNRARQVALGASQQDPGSPPPYCLGRVSGTGQLLQRIRTCRFSVINRGNFGLKLSLRAYVFKMTQK